MSLKLKNSRMEIDLNIHSKTASITLADGLCLTAAARQASDRECIMQLDLKKTPFQPQFTLTYAKRGADATYKGYAHVEYDNDRRTFKLVDTVVSHGKITDEITVVKLEDCKNG